MQIIEHISKIITLEALLPIIFALIFALYSAAARLFPSLAPTTMIIHKILLNGIQSNSDAKAQIKRRWKAKYIQ